jgi:hypothetical protein
MIPDGPQGSSLDLTVVGVRAQDHWKLPFGGRTKQVTDHDRTVPDGDADIPLNDKLILALGGLPFLREHSLSPLSVWRKTLHPSPLPCKKEKVTQDFHVRHLVGLRLGLW